MFARLHAVGLDLVRRNQGKLGPATLAVGRLE
jgi:hypothetical protein